MGVEVIEGSALCDTGVEDKDCACVSWDELCTDASEDRLIAEVAALVASSLKISSVGIESFVDWGFPFSSDMAPFCWIAGNSTSDVTLAFLRLLFNLLAREGKSSSGCEYHGNYTWGHVSLLRETDLWRR